MGIHPFDDDQMPLRGFSWSSCSTAPVTPNGASAPTTERLDMEGLSGALMAQADLGKGLRPAAPAGGLANQRARRRRRRRAATPEHPDLLPQHLAEPVELLPSRIGRSRQHTHMPQVGLARFGRLWGVGPATLSPITHLRAYSPPDGVTAHAPLIVHLSTVPGLSSWARAGPKIGPTLIWCTRVATRRAGTAPAARAA